MASFRFFFVALLACLGLAGLQAQAADTISSTNAETRGAQAVGNGPRAADFIVAIVNSEPITNVQVAGELARIRQQAAAQRRALPEAGELARQVLNQLINEKAQLQLARELGLRVDDPSVDQAEQAVARQNQLSIEQLYQQLARDGLSRQQFRDQLRDQLLMTRLREREVDPRVRVSEADIDQYLQEQQERSATGGGQLLNIAHILVSVPEGASEAQVAEARGLAEQVLQRARAGESFAALAREFSTAADRTNGGPLGLRSADRYPALFVEATRTLAPNGIAGPVRSGAGFHVLQLLDRREVGQPAATVTQSRARHILLVPNTQLSEAQAVAKLRDFKRRIQTGETDFATLARQNSQDGSAAQGGDLGWANPGMFVPEFERVLDGLGSGQISEPLISRFGVHLIQLLERRTATLSAREQRDQVRNVLREKKYGEAYNTWAQDVRARAYVELREAPQ